MNNPSLHLSAAVAPRLILLGTSIVMIAIALPNLPIAASIALVALGSVAILKRPGALLLALVVYAPLGALAVAAQMHVAIESSLVWRLWATLDAAVAILLLLAMVRHAGVQLARGA